MTKEEIEKEIAEIDAGRDYNITAIIEDRDDLIRGIEEFARNAMTLVHLYADEKIEGLNKLLEGTHDD